MTLTCQPKAGSKHLFTLFEDEDPLCDFHVTIFGRRPRFSSQEDFNQQEYGGARRYALKLLAAQSMLSSSLKEKLSNKLVSDSTIEKIIDECQENGYLNDEEWVASFIRVQKRKCVGPQVIRMKLQQKGVTASLIEKYLEVDQNEQIHTLLTSKYASRNLEDYKEKQKVIASLHRKGYQIGSILQVMESLGN